MEVGSARVVRQRGLVAVLIMVRHDTEVPDVRGFSTLVTIRLSQSFAIGLFLNASLGTRELQDYEDMKLYLFSLLAGVLVGVIYSIINVRSPAPPLVALVGLLGILGGEQIIPVAKQMLSGTGFHTAWQESKCTQHMFGLLPGRQNSNTSRTAAADSSEKRS